MSGLPDALGARFPDDQIRDSLGVQVAFTSERRGDELVFIADVQNNWAEKRLVVYTVAISSGSSGRRATFPRAEYSAELAGGEVGRFELVASIPSDAEGRFQFIHSLRHSHRGSVGAKCRAIPRRLITNDHSSGDRVGMFVGLGIVGLALGYRTPRNACVATFDVEPGPRSFAAPRGTYTSILKPEAPLPVVPYERTQVNWKQLAVASALVAIGAVALTILDILTSP